MSTSPAPCVYFNASLKVDILRGVDMGRFTAEKGYFFEGTQKKERQQTTVFFPFLFFLLSSLSPSFFDYPSKHVMGTVESSYSGEVQSLRQDLLDIEQVFELSFPSSSSLPFASRFCTEFGNYSPGASSV